MPNLQGVSLVGRDDGGRLYAARTIDRSWPSLATSWARRIFDAAAKQ